MIFQYCDMLSGEPIKVDGVGTLISPRLCKIKPQSGIGYSKYSLYLSCLSWDKEGFVSYANIMQFKNSDRLQAASLTAFDIIMISNELRDLCREVLSFFIEEKLIWENKRKCFVTQKNEAPFSTVGVINRKNFNDVRKMILQLNFIGLDEKQSVPKFANDKAKIAWENAQKHIQEQNKKARQNNDNKDEYSLGNVISKICAAHPSYNLLNIYDLTVFQLYDQFFEIAHLRSANLSEQIFSNHGGEKFRFDDWLKPIVKIT